MKDSEFEKISKFFRRIRTSIATENYRRFKEETGLIRLGIDPETIKRPGGRPPVHMVQENPEGLPMISHSPAHIVEIVFKQKWMEGRMFTNAGSDKGNACFVAAAGLFGCDATVLRNKFYEVPKGERDEIELRLVKLLYEHDAIKPTRRKKAKELLGI